MTYNNKEEDPTPDEMKKLLMCVFLYIIIVLLSNIFSKYGFN